ncbi:MAG: hypothetical protein IT541_12025 [Hyphomicrobiales bacterium]|nr:hypothetical protein [Hyphomicrobiales bacterium]
MAAQLLRQVFGIPRYALLALASAALVFILATWLPNLGLVWEIGTSASVPLAAKVAILWAFVGSIGTNFTLFSALALTTLALLFGANVSLLAYGVNLRRQGQTGAVASAGGLFSGLLGVGCATCGTFVITPLLTFMGAGGLLAALPFGGEEFAIVGIALLGLSFLLTVKKLTKPIACAKGNR